ncbi:hypothetical protein CI109_102000 [Kwoniella shandongensis]|uniref:Uncharacterized protein n=1 Tax=Kwoniella shandongensis TaxID=1734106 RepID=A0A5M6BQS2_9TREE|nr:uncharacterized protein CI109_006565 [Kwoniella shandongensis]KAA5525103.1 hypothetical protein CI109_006565 [Kwoniella shandongensis]
MSPTLLPLFAVLLLATLALAQNTYTVHHRFLPHPAPSTPPPFVSFGSFTPVARSLDLQVDALTGKQEVGQTDDGKGWYQVGVAAEEDDEWLIASTRACYLSSPPKVRIHIDDSLIPSHISIQPSSSSLTSCQTTTNSTSVKLPSKPEEIVWERYTSGKTRGPSLAPPPPIDTTTGAPIEPVPEKTFLAKYWMYILGAALFLFSQLAPEEPKPAGGGGGAAK